MLSTHALSSKIDTAAANSLMLLSWSCNCCKISFALFDIHLFDRHTEFFVDLVETVSHCL